MDRGHKGLTLQRALHYRQQTVTLVVSFNGQDLPAVKMSQQDANRFINAMDANPVPGITGIRIASR